MNNLSRDALRRVLGSLLAAEIGRARGRRASSDAAGVPSLQAFDDDMRVSSDGVGDLGCDSLERLQLAATTNEMFHLHEAADADTLLAPDRFGHWLDAVEAAWQAGVRHVTFATSGTTATPKRCTHSFDHLDAEVSFLAEVFADRTRIVALAPAHHIYGFLFTALLPDRLGIPVWQAEGAAPGVLARALRAGDLVVSFPARWSWLERSLPGFAPGVVGVMSTGPCPPALLHALRAKGLDGVAEIYGSSETAGIALRHAPDAPYRLMPHWSISAAGNGDAPTLEHRSGLRLPMPDRIAHHAGGLFTLGGRVDGAVQVGGINVHPGHLAEVIRQWPGVAQAAVRLMRPAEGTRLKAFVVADGSMNDATLLHTLDLWSSRTLAPAERPKSFTIGPALPTTALGKAADW